ncbi:hypothetical protein PybrP1_002455 [[Pythium] brassicae (nom. inval.)]|nr:hypothetical protein PybrP1_002455 [[Pythium] brassicae (nom. inval.)]
MSSSNIGSTGASLSDLKDVLKQTLDARGSLGQLKARIRAEVFAALDDQDVPKPRLSNENLVINELVREYLEYNGYRHALSVFLPESGQPAEKPFSREFLSQELGDPRFEHVPLLYSIVAGLQQQVSEASGAPRDDGSGLQHLREFRVAGSGSSPAA